MAWRAFNSILVLRDQVDAIAPDRATGADGTICDENHPVTSDHCPHYVSEVGSEMVSALDLTHDPNHGFDSYWFADVLRRHRDNRLKYVISNTRMFSSYATSNYPAWTWRPYSGEDPHTGHVHISVLDAVISDSKTPWNLEGFGTMTPGQQYVQHVMNYRLDAILHNRDTVNVPAFTATDGTKFPAINEANNLAGIIATLTHGLADLGTKLGTTLTAVEDLIDEVKGSSVAGVYTATGDLTLTRQSQV